MGSSSSSSYSIEEWLELSLGFRSSSSSVTKKKEAEKQEEKEKRDNIDDEDGNLELRLQIGPNNNTNYNNNNRGLIMDYSLVYQYYNNNHQKWDPLFHTHHPIIPHYYYNSINNNFGLISSSSPISPNSSGLWFSLLSSPNRKDGAALPQIPKPYLRVKDEKMTVLMVKKYLVTKLSLSNEAQVELWCMGERLLHTQSLKQVRDGVWMPKLVDLVNSNSTNNSSSIFHQNHQSPSSSSTYLMSLHYGTTTCFF